MPPPTQTCSACRGRKVRCDGVQPMCGPCSKARKPIDCVYTPATAIASTPKGEYLKKGAACAPCRRKKKKCDADRPFCSTCKVAGKEKECTYEENTERTLTEALFMRTHYLEQRLAQYEHQVAPMAHPQGLPDGILPLMDLTHPDQPTASSSRLSHSGGGYSVPVYNIPHALNVLFDCMNVPSPTTDLTLSAPHIPQGLEEFRETYIEHSRQYGSTLSPEKMEAILAGDVSGAVVHPAFTYVAQLLGCLFWQMERRMMNMYSSVEREQEQLLFGVLDTIDPVGEVQVRYLLAIYYLFKQQMVEGEEQLVLGADVVRRHNLVFPTSTDAFDPLQMQEATPDQVELISALSHMLYLDRCSSFVFHVPTRLDKNFDDALKNVALYYPFLAKTNTTYIRARSLLYLIRVHELVTHWESINAATPTGMFSGARPAWFNAYWPLLEEITSSCSHIDGEMLKASFYGERPRAIALKFSLVVMLSAKAQLHWLVHRTHDDSAQRALDTVMEVVSVTKTFKDNDFFLLDPLLGVCWSTVAKIMMDIIRSPPKGIGEEISWTAALKAIDKSTKKLGHEFPFVEESLQVVSDVMRIVEVQ
ncbi:hypothetical protein OH76DRAFT_1395982 [Lentinus brumalis]|uniref:Zn(2)-C6 fungal-type domain-containing protein n=1 Tax=Lentinus brumalis TaxID=2498619 RepID=A0A371DWB1_9APHY|nr:hypothetical protein OH76DRAFT_1395982 [Polyporus brumalis]